MPFGRKILFSAQQDFQEEEEEEEECCEESLEIGLEWRRRRRRNGQNKMDEGKAKKKKI